MTWTLTIDQCGRPLLANQERRNHWRTNARERKAWNHTTATLAAAARIPRCAAITVTVQARYPRGPLPDGDALAPTAKGCIDGLKAAGVVEDDRGEFVRSITYLPPVVAKGLPPALILTIEEAA